jgi:hypothetical protein
MMMLWLVRARIRRESGTLLVFWTSSLPWRSAGNWEARADGSDEEAISP